VALALPDKSGFRPALAGLNLRDSDGQGPPSSLQTTDGHGRMKERLELFKLIIKMNMSYKKIIFVTSFLTIFCFLFNFNVQAVKSMTTAEIQALIAQLQAQIAQLQKQLTEVGGTPAVWCHDFNTSLRYEDTGSEVEALQAVLEKEGLYGPPSMKSKDSPSYFGDYTASAVVSFQEKYRKDILEPLGLTHGTGFVGKSTRTELNTLYGCGVITPTTPILQPTPIASTPIPTPTPTPTPTPQVTTTPTITSSIAVLSPNGGEQWSIGNTYTVKWGLTGSIAGVHFELYKGGVFFAGLGGMSPSPTSFTWDTVNTSNLMPGSDYKIRIKSSEDPTVYDESDNYFNITTSLPSPNNCVDLKSYAATNYYFDLCKKGGYDRICFNKYYSTYQGCGRSLYYDDCTVQNANAENNIWCDTNLVYACNDSDSSGNYGKNYYTKGTVTEAGKTPAFYKNGKYYLDGKEFIPTVDYCVDSSVLKEYFCSISDSYPTGIVSEENYTCPSGCEDGVCKTEEKKPVLKDIENQLASVSAAISQLIGRMKELTEIR